MSTLCEDDKEVEQARKIEKKAGDIARCLGYQHTFQDNAGTVEVEEPSVVSRTGAAGDAAQEQDVSQDVDMWHLRSLAIQPGGLLNSHGRKLGWIKLAGVDGLVFNGDEAHHCNGEGSRPASAAGDDYTYEQIQQHLEQEMELSRWHIQRERRRLRKKNRGGDNSTCQSGTLSPASSKNDLSSIGSRSGSSTPLTANLNASYAGTPKSVSFHGLAPKHAKDSSSLSTYMTVDTSPESNTTSDANPSSKYANNWALSPLSFSSPTALPQCNLSNKFQWDLTSKSSYSQYSHPYQKNHRMTKTRHKKDRRAQERKLLVQIGTSAFYLLNFEAQGIESPEKYQYYPGMQDLIAVLLLHVESPSLASLMLKQVLKSHLSIFSTVADGNSDSDFASCIDDNLDDISEEGRNPDSLSMSFLPLLQTLDTDLHDSILQLSTDKVETALMFGEVVHKWISSWFCCHDSLPLSVISRIVDFFLASNPAMPLYLSIAIICQPVNKDKFISLSSGSSWYLGQEPSQAKSTPWDANDMSDNVSTLLRNLFSNLSTELSLLKSSTDADNGHSNQFPLPKIMTFDGTDEELVLEFIDDAISMAVSFMTQHPPQDLFSLVENYQGGFLVPFVSQQEFKKLVPDLPWLKRHFAPTDYHLIQKSFGGEKLSSTKQCTTSKRDVEKHQIALDASGFHPSELKFGNGNCMMQYLCNMDRVSRTAILVLFSLCISTQLLHSKQLLFGGNIISLPSEDDHVIPRLQSLLHQSNNLSAQPMVMNTSIENDLDSDSMMNNDTAVGLGMVSPSSEVDADGLVGSLSETEDTIPPSLPSDGSLEQVQDVHDALQANSKGVADLPLKGTESAKQKGAVDETSPTGSSGKDYHIADTTWKILPYKDVDWKRHKDLNEPQSPIQAEAREAADIHLQDDGSSIGKSAEQEEPPLVSHSVENRNAEEQAALSYANEGYSPVMSKKKLGGNFKKLALQGLKKFKLGYIALVEDDDFFL